VLSGRWVFWVKSQLQKRHFCFDHVNRLFTCVFYQKSSLLISVWFLRALPTEDITSSLFRLQGLLIVFVALQKIAFPSALDFVVFTTALYDEEFSMTNVNYRLKAKAEHLLLYPFFIRTSL